MKVIPTLRKVLHRLLSFRRDKLGIIAQIKARHLTYLSPQKLDQLIASLREIEEKGVEGRLIEAGCALGGSLVLIAAYAPNRAISVYDTFEMIPPPGEEDPPEVHKRYAFILSGESKGIGGEKYYGYRGDLREFVLNQISELVGAEATNQIDLHKGLLQDTMALDTPVAFAHIDVDWYDPVKTCVVRLWPLLPKGGILIFDDYLDWGGCKKAVDEFFQGRSDMTFDDSAGNLKVTKI